MVAGPPAARASRGDPHPPEGRSAWVPMGEGEEAVILPRDQLVSLLERSSVQVVGTPGAEWIRTTMPVLARNTVDETIIASGEGCYWSPRGFYLRLEGDLVGGEGNETVLPAGTDVFVDPSSSVKLVGKSEGGVVRPAKGPDTFLDAAVGVSLIVGVGVFVGVGLG